MEPFGFSMPHQSFVVNMFHVKNVRGQQILLDNGMEIPLSQKKLKTWKQELTVYLSQRLEGEVGTRRDAGGGSIFYSVRSDLLYRMQHLVSLCSAQEQRIFPVVSLGSLGNLYSFIYYPATLWLNDAITMPVMAASYLAIIWIFYHRSRTWLYMD